jgi:hypothetical protein
MTMRKIMLLACVPAVLLIAGCATDGVMKAGETTKGLEMATIISREMSACRASQSATEASLTPEQVSGLKATAQAEYFRQQGELAKMRLVAGTTRGGCEDIAKIGAAYYNMLGQETASKYQFFGQGLSLIGNVGMAAVIADGVARIAKPRNSNTINMDSYLDDGATMDTKLNIGGSFLDNASTFTQGEKVITNPDTSTAGDGPAGNVDLNDSNDGSGNSAGLLR